MNELSVFHQMENWGYYLLPKLHQHSPGYTGLLVAIREIPTGMHFDPESIRLKLQDEDGAADWATLGLRSPFWESRHVCPGRVILRDRVDKRVEFFVFGGSLEATSVPSETVYSLRSPAPILELTEPPGSIPDQLASETEVVVGELEARWGLNEEGFARRLAQVATPQFYLASLHSILARYKHSRALRETFHDLYDALLEEKCRLMEAGQWSVTPFGLEELLAPD
ncbi:MAG: hypothetical protein PVF45_02525 [Anaerolineae bacterium]|jgi:hypothetical protein